MGREVSCQQRRDAFVPTIPVACRVSSERHVITSLQPSNVNLPRTITSSIPTVRQSSICSGLAFAVSAIMH